VRRKYLVIGALLVVTGVIGVRQHSLAGFFAGTAVHSMIHVVSGVVTVLAARRGIGAMRTWGKVLGLLYLIVAIAGFALPGGSLPPDVLHLGLAAFFLYYGLLAPPIL
jgi:hypothetical protein